MLDDLLTAAGSINWPLTAGTAALFILIARFGLLLLLAVTNNIDPETPESRPRRERTDGVLPQKATPNRPPGWISPRAPSGSSW